MTRIGIEYEGVLLKKGKPIRFSQLDYKTVQRPITEQYFNEYCCDGNDYLIEVRTTPHTSPELLLNEFFFKKARIERLLKKYGLSVRWTEMPIPNQEPDEKKGNKTQEVFDANGRHYLECKDSKFRGGGLHINFDVWSSENYPKDIKQLFKMYWKVKYTEKMFKFKSLYRNKLLFREHPFGYELMSVGFALTSKKNKQDFIKLIHKLYE